MSPFRWLRPTPGEALELKRASSNSAKLKYSTLVRGSIEGGHLSGRGAITCGQRPTMFLLESPVRYSRARLTSKSNFKWAPSPRRSSRSDLVIMLVIFFATARGRHTHAPCMAARVSINVGRSHTQGCNSRVGRSCQTCIPDHAAPGQRA